MKFLYINNELCEECNKCLSLCPTTAIYLAEGKRRINYDKCVSCGNCLRDCVHNAITIERVEHLTREIERFEAYKSKIEYLEKENQVLTDSVQQLQRDFRVLIECLPVAIVVTDAECRVLSTNGEFIRLLDYESTEVAEMVPGLVGAEFKQLVPPSIYSLFQNSSPGDQILNKILYFNEKQVSLSVYNLKQNGMILGVVRNLYDETIAREEIMDRIGQVVDREMSMVQKIGFLLGEEASEISKQLSNVVKILETGKDAE